MRWPRSLLNGLNSSPGSSRPSFTHFTIRAIARSPLVGLLHNACSRIWQVRSVERAIGAGGPGRLARLDQDRLVPGEIGGRAYHALHAERPAGGQEHAAVADRAAEAEEHLARHRRGARVFVPIGS